MGVYLRVPNNTLRVDWTEHKDPVIWEARVEYAVAEASGAMRVQVAKFSYPGYVILKNRHDNQGASKITFINESYRWEYA